MYITYYVCICISILYICIIYFSLSFFILLSFSLSYIPTTDFAISDPLWNMVPARKVDVVCRTDGPGMMPLLTSFGPFLTLQLTGFMAISSSTRPPDPSTPETSSRGRNIRFRAGGSRRTSLGRNQSQYGSTVYLCIIDTFQLTIFGPPKCHF